MIRQCCINAIVLFVLIGCGGKESEKTKESTSLPLTPVLAPTNITAIVVKTDDIKDVSVRENARDAYASHVILLTWQNLDKSLTDWVVVYRANGTNDFAIAARRWPSEDFFYDVAVKPSTTYIYYLGVSDERRGSASSMTVTITTPPSPHPAPSPDSPPQWLLVTSPTTDDLSSVWGSSTDSVYILGYSWERYRHGKAASILYHFNGVWFRSEYAPRTDPLRTLWGFSENDLWAAGNSILAHYTGGSWNFILSPPTLTAKNIYGLWGAAPNDIWAVGTNGTPGMFSLHYAGREWRWDPPGTELFDLWGFSSTDVWAIGGNWLGTYILHYDGRQWTQVWGGSVQEWGTCIWGVAPNDLWVVGSNGFILHYDGNSWQRVPSPTNKNLQALWGFSSTDVWAGGEGGVLLHYNGVAWIVDVHPATEDILDLWGTSPTDLWAVGKRGTILRRR